jgi:hypothetical protein
MAIIEKEKPMAIAAAILNYRRLLKRRNCAKITPSGAEVLSRESYELPFELFRGGGRGKNINRQHPSLESI